MAVRTIDCGACGATVPYGRLSCPACGELLASVAGSMRPLRWAVTGTTPVGLEDPVGGPPEPAPEPAPVASADTSGTLEPTGWTDPPLPSVLHDPTELPPPVTDAGPDADDQPAWPPPAPAPASGSWPPVAPVPAAAVPAAAVPAAPSLGPVPGAYLPPTTVAAGLATTGPSLAPAAALDPPAIPAPARAWAGTRGSTEAASSRDGSAASELRALTDPARRDEMIGWVAVAGGTLGALGFLLPWSRTVIGTTGIDYFSSWGLGGPGHPLVVVALLAVVALGVVGDRVPAWLRVGVPGLLLGGLLVGLTWPYLIGPLGALPGVWLSVAGAAVLVVAAIAAVVTGRHGTAPQDV